MHHSGPLSGWFVQDFLGLHRGELKEIPSGVNIVPLTLTDGVTEEQAALAAGVTGFKITEGDVTEGDVTEGGVTEGDLTYPSVQPMLGWGLLMDPYSVF